MLIRVGTPLYYGAVDSRPEIQDLKSKRVGDLAFDMQTATGTYIDDNRNALVNHNGSQKKRQCVGGFDALLFSDLDVRFGVHDVLRLVGHNKPIVGGAYLSRGDAHFVEAGLFGLPGEVKFRYTKLEQGLKKVDFVGAGFLLVRRQVFENLDFPWFRRFVLEKGDCAVNVGEDLAFCIAAKAAGYDIYCDFDLSLTHQTKE